MFDAVAAKTHSDEALSMCLAKWHATYNCVNSTWCWATIIDFKSQADNRQLINWSAYQYQHYTWNPTDGSACFGFTIRFLLHHFYSICLFFHSHSHSFSVEKTFLRFLVTRMENVRNTNIHYVFSLLLLLLSLCVCFGNYCFARMQTKSEGIGAIRVISIEK